jgi:hypothetical protein
VPSFQAVINDGAKAQRIADYHCPNVDTCGQSRTDGAADLALFWARMAACVAFWSLAYSITKRRCWSFHRSGSRRGG